MVPGGVGQGENAKGLVAKDKTYMDQLGIVNVKVGKEVMDESMGCQIL